MTLIFLIITLYLVVAATLFKVISEKRIEFEAEAIAENLMNYNSYRFSKYDVEKISKQKGVSNFILIFFYAETRNNYLINLLIACFFWLPFYILWFPMAGIWVLMNKYSKHKTNKREMLLKQILVSKATNSVTIHQDNSNE